MTDTNTPTPSYELIQYDGRTVAVVAPEDLEQLERDLAAANAELARYVREDAIKASANKMLMERAERSEAERDAALRIFPLLASAWFYGEWKAETANEREMQAIMEAVGWWPFKTEDSLIAAIDQAREGK